MTGRMHDLRRKYESGSQKRTRKEERETKSIEVESKCKKINQFFPNVNKLSADPSPIQCVSNDNQVVEAMNLESTTERFALAFSCCTLCVVDYVIVSVLFLFAPSLNLFYVQPFNQNILLFFINQNNKSNSVSLI